MIGWICPVCGEANGPLNDRCVNGPHAHVEIGIFNVLHVQEGTNCGVSGVQYGRLSTQYGRPR